MNEQSINDINDALIVAAKSQAAGLRTVEMYRSDYNDKEIGEIIIKAPFVLFHYLGIFPVDGERMQGGETGIIEDRWNVYFGFKHQSGAVQSERGCIELFESFRSMLDGGTITVNDQILKLSLIGGGPLTAKGSDTIYYAQFNIYQ